MTRPKNRPMYPALEQRIIKQEERLRLIAAYAGHIERSSLGHKHETVYSNRGYRCETPLNDGKVFMSDISEEYYHIHGKSIYR